MRSTRLLVFVALLLAVAAAVQADPMVTFTASEIESVVGPLHDATDQWGLWAVRARPIVDGGTYTITGAATSQTGWGTTAPSSYAWHTYGTNCAWFWDASGAEAAGTASNPLYMMMDVPDGNFYSYGFDHTGTCVAQWAPGPDGIQGTSDDLGTFLASGYDAGAGGTNVVTAVQGSSTFSFTFTVDSGTWNGAWEFLVDGSRYTLGTAASPGVWKEDFFGDYTLSGGTPGGGLSGNMGSGYGVVPEPFSMAFLASAFVGVVAVRLRGRRKGASRK